MLATPYDSPGGIIAASVVTEILALAAVGLRFYSRRWKRQKYIVSDWLILVALVVGTGLAVMEIYGVTQHALGYPIGVTLADDLVAERFYKLKRIDLAFILLGVVGTGFVKLSVCFLYWHLFSRVVFRRFLMVWTCFVATWMVAFVLVGLLECGTHLTAVLGTPDEYFAYCQAAIPAGYAMMATDVVTDFVTLVIPVPVVLGITLDRRTRWLTLLTFMVGSLSVGASIAKTYYYVIAATGQYTEDAMLTLTGLSLWNLLEVQIGILAACGPTLRSILRQAIFTPTTSSLKSLLSRLGVVTSSSSSPSRGTPSNNDSDDSAGGPHAAAATGRWARGAGKKDELPSFVKIPEGWKHVEYKTAVTVTSGPSSSSSKGSSTLSSATSTLNNKESFSQVDADAGYYGMDTVGADEEKTQGKILRGDSMV